MRTFTEEEVKQFLSRVKGKHVKKVWQMLIEIQDKIDEDTGVAMKYTNLLDDIGCEVTDLSMKEWNEIPAEEQNKITNGIEELVQNKIGFTKTLRK